MRDFVIGVLTLIIITKTLSFSLLMFSKNIREIRAVWKYGIGTLVILTPTVNCILKILGLEKLKENLDKFHYKLKDEIHLTNDINKMSDYINLVNILSKDVGIPKKEIRTYLLLHTIYKNEIKGPIKLKTFSHIFGETGVTLFDLKESKTDYGSYSMLVYKTRGLKFIKSENGQKLVNEAVRVNGWIHPDAPKVVAFYADMRRLYPILTSIK